MTWTGGGSAGFGALLLYTAATEIVVSRPTLKAETASALLSIYPALALARSPASSAEAPLADRLCELSPMNAKVFIETSAIAAAMPTPPPCSEPTAPAMEKDETSCSALTATLGAVISARLLIDADVVLSKFTIETMPFKPRPDPEPEVGATP